MLSKKKEKPYTEEQVALAVPKVKSGEFSHNKTAKSFSIPVATLHRRVQGIGETIGRGSNTRLSQQLESILVDILIKLSDWGFGRTCNDVITLVTDYLQHQCQSHLFPNDTPGKDWYKLFINRWSHKFKHQGHRQYIINQSRFLHARNSSKVFQHTAKRVQRRRYQRKYFMSFVEF